MLVVGDLLTMDGARRVIACGAVAVRGAVIEAVGTVDELRRAYPDHIQVGEPGALVTPGFVNGHQHLTGDRLVASCIPDTITSNEAIFGWAVPVHEAHTGDDDELSATLAAADALTRGVTCTVEAGTVAHPDRVAAGVRAAGMRTILGRWGWDAEGVPFGAPAAEVIAAQRALLDRYPAGDGVVHAGVTLVGHDLVSDELFAGAAALARERGVLLTFHMSPHDGDAAAFLATGRPRPMVHLQRLGVLGPQTLVAHAVHLDDAEVSALVTSGAAVAACPWAYLRLAQGVTVAGRYGTMWRQGVRFAVGCDSENASDAVDVLRAAALFTGLLRDGAMDPTIADASDALWLATQGGAAAIGMADRIGSIEPGKQADLVVHRPHGPAWTPRAPDPIRQLVWNAGAGSVGDVLVAGRHVVADGRCRTVDVGALAAAAADRQRFLLDRAASAQRQQGHAER